MCTVIPVSANNLGSLFHVFLSYSLSKTVCQFKYKMPRYRREDRAMPLYISIRIKFYNGIVRFPFLYHSTHLLSFFALLNPPSTLILGVFPLHQIGRVGVSERISLKLFGREIIFEVFQPM